MAYSTVIYFHRAVRYREHASLQARPKRYKRCVVYYNNILRLTRITTETGG